MTDDLRRRHGRSKADRRRHEPPDVGKFRRECVALKDFAEPGRLPTFMLSKLRRPLRHFEACQQPVVPIASKTKDVK